MSSQIDEERAKRNVQQMLDNPSISKANKSYMLSHVAHLHANSADPKTVSLHLYYFRRFVENVNPKLDLKRATKADIEVAIVNIEALPVSAGIKQKVKIFIKAFYKHLLGDDLFYPPQVVWIKARLKRSAKMLPQNLLSDNEVKTLLETATNLRDKAIIALLFDAGLRPGELLSMRMCDVNLSKNPAEIMVSEGKTGMRQIPIIFSVTYLAQYLNSLTGSRKKPESPLWIELGTSSNHETGLTISGLQIMIKKTAKKAGIQRRIYPYLFRHTRATWYANKITEQQLKAIFGWVGDSKMASVYVHLSGRDINNAVLQANGLKPIDDPKEPYLKARNCQRCQEANTIESRYCIKCGAPLDINTALEFQKRESSLGALIGEWMKDPKIREEVVHEYLMQERAARKRAR